MVVPVHIVVVGVAAVLVVGVIVLWAHQHPHLAISQNLPSSKTPAATTAAAAVMVLAAVVVVVAVMTAMLLVV